MPSAAQQHPALRNGLPRQVTLLLIDPITPHIGVKLPFHCKLRCLISKTHNPTLGTHKQSWHNETLAAQAEIKDRLKHMRLPQDLTCKALPARVKCSGPGPRAQGCTCLLTALAKLACTAAARCSFSHLPRSALVHVLLHRHSLHWCFLRMPSAEG